MISTVMTDPFAMAHTPSVLSAAKALKAATTNGWPRIPDTDHASTILRIVILCWLNLHDESSTSPVHSSESNAIDQELRLTVKILQHLWSERSIKPPELLNEILQREPRLSQLLQSGEEKEEGATRPKDAEAIKSPLSRGAAA